MKKPILEEERKKEKKIEKWRHENQEWVEKDLESKYPD